MHVVRFEDAPRTENVQGRHIRHCAPTLGSAEILMGRTTKDPGPCAPYIHKHDHEDVIVMLRGSFTLRVGDEEVTIREGDTLIIPPDTVHTPVAAGPDGCELIGMSVADIRSFKPDGTEIGVGFESLNKQAKSSSEAAAGQRVRHKPTPSPIGLGHPLVANLEHPR